jgi:hypothetical protein
MVRLLTSSTIRMDHQKYVPGKGTYYPNFKQKIPYFSRE